MGFGEAFQKGLANIGNFEGRSARAEFWWFVLGVWIAEFVIFMLMNLILRNGGFFYSLVAFTVWVVAFLAILSVSIRRLHDVGQSGWLVLLWLIPCVGLVLIYFFVQPSQGPNQYGPPPA